MEGSKQGMDGGEWMAVPAFGAWDKTAGGAPDYSLDFSKIRAHRKIHKSDFALASPRNEDKVHDINGQQHRRRASDDHRRPQLHVRQSDHSTTESTPELRARKSIMSCFQCCIRA